MKKTHSFSLLTKVLVLIVIVLSSAFIFKDPLNVFAALVPATPEVTSVAAQGYINSIASGNNKLYIAGEFTYFGPNTGNAYPINKTTGVIIDDYPTRFYPSVERIIPDGSSGWYVAGWFGTKGASTVYKLVHLLSDGTIDPSFTSSVSSSCTIQDLVLVGSVLYVGGAAGGSSCLMALNASTGADTGWNPGPGGVNNVVYAIAVSGNTVYVGGAFSTAGGVNRNQGAAFAADTGALLAWNPGISNSSIKDIKVNGSVVYLGGNFSYTLNLNFRMGLAAVDATTGDLENWDPNVVLGGSNEVKDMYFDGTNLYIVGRFDTVSGQARKGLAKFDATIPDAPVLLSWNAGLVSGNAAAIDSDGTNLYVGGYFHSAIGGQTRTGLVALNPSTALATSWNPVTPSDVDSISVSGNVVFVGNRGDAGSYGGVAAGSALVEFDPVTQEVVPVITDDGSNFMDIYEMAWDDDILYIAGDFSYVTIGGETRSYLAAIDTTTMQFTDWNPQPNTTVRALKVTDDRIYIGGSFSSIGVNPIGKLAAFDKSTGAIIGAWTPAPSSTIYSIVTSSDGNTVYAGGSFGTIGGQNRNNIAAVNKDTGLATSWDPDSNGTVRELYLNDTTLYVGGNFSNIGGQGRNYSAALNTTVDTNNALTFNPNTDSTVYAIALNDDVIYLGGDFWEVAAGGHIGVAAVDPITGVLEAWDASVGSNGFMNNSPDNEVKDIEAYGGAVFVGGDFHTIATYDPVLYADLDSNLTNFTSINFQPFFAQFGTFTAVAASTPTVGFALTSSSGNEAVASPTLTINLSAISVSNVTVAYGITGGTATGGGVDYTLASGTATILAGATTTTVPLVIVDDSVVESDETVAVSLSSPSNATLGANITHTYTIINDDVASGGGSGGSNGGNGPIVGTYGTSTQPIISLYVPPTKENIEACMEAAPQLSNSITVFTKDLVFKQSDPQVKALQVFLNRNGYIISKSGEGSVGRESIYFGPATQNALKKFQKVYEKVIEAYFGNIKRHGDLDTPTRTFINSITTWNESVCERTVPPLPPPIQPPLLNPLPPEPQPVIVYPVMPPPFIPSLPNPPSSPIVPPSPLPPLATTSEFVVASTTATTTVPALVESTSTVESISPGIVATIVGGVLNFGETIKNGIEQLPSVGAQLQKINEFTGFVVVPAATAVLYSVPIQEKIIRITSFKDFALLLTSGWQSLLTFLGVRKRRRHWGTVYDSKSKQPIDPASVQLIDAESGLVVEEAITDMAGRYGFLTREGKFKIKVDKTNYSFPSKIISGKNDEVFDNVYYGEEFRMSEISNLIVPNIPMDPVNFDWNQMDKKRIIKFHPRMEYAISILTHVLYWFGFIMALYVYVTDNSMLNLAIIAIYMAVLVISVMMSYVRLWGKIYIKDGTPMANLLIELTSPFFDGTVFSKAKTAPDGRFFLKAFKGAYKLKVKKLDPITHEYSLIDTQGARVEDVGVYNKDVYIG